MIKSLIRPAMLIVPLFAGACFPELHILASYPCNVLRPALCLMIFINALQVRYSDLKPRVEHWKLLAANALIGIGMFFLLKIIYPENLLVAQNGFFAGIAPSAAASSVVISLLGGNVGFALTGFIISNIGISCMLLFLLPLVTGNFTALFFLDVLKTLLIVIALPLAASAAVRRVYPDIIGYIGKLKNVSLGLWSVSLLIIAAVARNFYDQQSQNSLLLIVAALIISLFCCALSFIAGFGLNRRFRSESSQLLGQKNTSFVIYIALEYASGGAALAAIFYVLFHNSWNSFQLLQISRRKKQGAVPDKGR